MEAQMLCTVRGHTMTQELKGKQLFLEKRNGEGSNQAQMYDLIGTWLGLE